MARHTPVQVVRPEPGGQEREALLRGDVGQRVGGVGIGDVVVLGDLPRDIRAGELALRVRPQHVASQQQGHTYAKKLRSDTHPSTYVRARVTHTTRERASRTTSTSTAAACSQL